MPNTFSGVEMLKIAILLEEEGADYYQKGAKNTTGEVSKFLLSAADQELSHKAMFTKLYDDMASDRREESEYLFDEEVTKYLGGLTENQIFSKDDNPDAFKDLITAVKASLKKEELTVKIYSELYKGVKDEGAKEVMNRIINEEKHHVAYFENLLKTLEK
jgi:rubrerythrin